MKSAAEKTLPPLSEREREILQLAGAGQKDIAIGAELGCSEHTVASHLRRVFDKLRIAGFPALTRGQVALLYAVKKPAKGQQALQVDFGF